MAGESLPVRVMDLSVPQVPAVRWKGAAAHFTSEPHPLLGTTVLIQEALALKGLLAVFAVVRPDPPF